MSKNEIDMLHGSLWNKIIMFALPLAATSILQQLFNAADLAVVGRFAGPEAMAAVGSNASVISLCVNLFVGMSVGANVVIGKMIGAGKQDRISSAVHTVILLAICSGLFLTCLGASIAKPILMMMGAPSEVMNLAVIYLRIYFCGMPVIMLYNFGSAVLRSKGDSRRPLMIMLIAGVINILLNLIFVIVFKLHVIGVALATVMSNVVSGGLVTFLLTREDGVFRLSLRKLAFDWECLWDVIKVGVPAGLQGMVFSISNVVIQSSINSFGSNAIAGSSSGQNFEFICYCVTNAFAQTAVTFTSQNYGAGSIERCKKVFLLTLGISSLATGTVGFVFTIFRHSLIRLFTTDPDVIEFAVTRILCLCPYEILIVIYEVTAGCMRGMGKSLPPSIITLIGTCGFRMLWVFAVLPLKKNFVTLMAVYPLSWIITASIMLLVYFMIRRVVFQNQFIRNDI